MRRGGRVPRLVNRDAWFLNRLRVLGGGRETCERGG
jgi:hypothetical protein